MIYMSLFSAIHTYDSRISADGSFEREKEETMEKIINNAPFALVLVFLVIGFVLLIKGADFFVEGSSSVAKRLHVPSIIIGLTIVAMGTSLPELVTSIVAARKNEVDMALGNVIGSNIFNILLVLGVAAAISPVKFLTDNIIDTVVLIAMSLVVLVFAWTSKMIDRREGATMLGMYAVYMAYICIR